MDIEQARAKAGRNLTKAMEAAQVSVGDLAARVGVTPSAVTNWRSRGTSHQYANQVAALLGCRPETIAVPPSLERRLPEASAGQHGVREPEVRSDPGLRDALLRLILDADLDTDDLQTLLRVARALADR